MALINGGFNTRGLIKEAERHELSIYKKLTGDTSATSLTPEIKTKLKAALNLGKTNRAHRYEVRGAVLTDEELHDIIDAVPIQQIAKNILLQEIKDTGNKRLSVGSYAEALGLELVNKKAQEIAKKHKWTYSIYSTKNPAIDDNNYDIGITFWDENGMEVTGMFDDDWRFESKNRIKPYFHVAGFDLDRNSPIGNRILEDLKKRVKNSTIELEKNATVYSDLLNGEVTVTVKIDMNQIKRWTEDLIYSKFNSNYPIFISPTQSISMLSSEVLAGLDTGQQGYTQLGEYKHGKDEIFAEQIRTKLDGGIVANTENQDDIEDALAMSGIYEEIYDKLEQQKAKFNLWYGRP